MSAEPIKYLNNLRVFATVLVICLHVCASYMFDYKLNRWQWEAVNALDSATRSCIGLFFMITGALLVQKSIEIKSFLKKRFSRIIYPFIFWSIVYVVFSYLTEHKPLDTIIQQSIYFGAYYHFWYVYILIGIYLFLPIISVFMIHANKTHLQYFLVIWTIWLASNMYIFDDILPNINLIYFSGYLGYVILGYYFHHVYKEIKTYKIILAIAIGYLITFIGTSIVSEKHGHLETTFYQYLDLNVTLMTAGFFLLFKYFITQSNAFIAFISKYSYGIYFIHPLFIYYFKHYSITFSAIWVVDILIKTIIVTLLSLFAIYSLNKVPRLKLFIG